MNNLFGSPISLSDAIKRATVIAPYKMPDGSLVENPNVTAARQATEQAAQPAKSKIVLYAMMAGAVILAGVLIFVILKRK